MTARVYLDFNATAPLCPQARAAMLAALESCGNPSSVHAEGRAARQIIEAARENVAVLVGAQARNVVFTSGGTEANMLALSPGNGCERLLVSAIEHPSVLAGGRFPLDRVEQIPVTAAGVIDLAALRRALANGGRALVSVMLANNETGVVQPIAEVVHLVREAGGLLHVDAVQALARIACDINALGADLLTISGHKIGAPKGVGALVKRTEAVALDPLITGGGQERGARAGTENVAAIAGLGAAAARSLTAPPAAPTAPAAAPTAPDRARQSESVALLRARLEAGLQALSPEVVIFGAEAQRLPNTTLFSVPGLKAETAVIAFDLQGVAVSSGAACSSGKVQPSHVLAAMGIPPDLARGAVRVSLGPTTAESEINRFLEAWNTVSRSLLNRTRGLAA